MHRLEAKQGGHKAVDPDLGTLEDFDWLVDQVHQRGMEIALDFAINCSPGSSVCQGASRRVVLPTTGRHDQIRGESAKKIRRHLPAEFPLRKLARTVGRDEKHHFVLGGARRPDFPSG